MDENREMSNLGLGETNMDDDDSTDLSEVTSDMSELSNSHYQGIVLLQKLQQLKVSFFLTIHNINKSQPLC